MDETDRDQLPTMVNKILQRRHLPLMPTEEILAATGVHHIGAPTVQFAVKIDLRHFYRAMLQIVYELAWYWLGDRYLDDPYAARIRTAMWDDELDYEAWSTRHALHGTLGFYAES